MEHSTSINKKHISISLTGIIFISTLFAYAVYSALYAWSIDMKIGGSLIKTPIQALSEHMSDYDEFTCLSDTKNCESKHAALQSLADNPEVKANLALVFSFQENLTLNAFKPHFMNAGMMKLSTEMNKSIISAVTPVSSHGIFSDERLASGRDIESGSNNTPFMISIAFFLITLCVLIVSILDNRENDNEILDAAAGDLPESKMMGINALFDEKPLTYALYCLSKKTALKHAVVGVYSIIWLALSAFTLALFVS